MKKIIDIEQENKKFKYIQASSECVFFDGIILNDFLLRKWKVFLKKENCYNGFHMITIIDYKDGIRNGGGIELFYE